MNPEFTAFLGPMFSSKTSQMLMTLERYKYQKKRIVVFKPTSDNRYDPDHVVTHAGWKIEAVKIDDGQSLLAHLKSLDKMPNVIAVDELFMIDGIADVLIWLYRKLGITIVVSSLDLSFSCAQFNEVKKIMPWATKIEKCSAVCAVCGAEARFTHKKNVSNEELEIGGSELYEPRCWQHHQYFQKV